MAMGKYEVLQAIGNAGVVAVIRATNSREGMDLARAVQKGGVPAVEVTMTVTLVNGSTAQLISKVQADELNMGDTAPVSFDLETELDLARVDYSLSAQTGNTLR